MLKTLEPVDDSRTCFRLIGGVLVERTVAEVRPAVKANSENLRLVIPHPHPPSLAIFNAESVLIERVYPAV